MNADAPIPQGSDSESSDHESDLSRSPYALTSSADIIGVLREVVRSRAMLQLRVPPGVTSLVTTLLKVDAEGVVIDQPGDVLAERMASGAEFILETSLDQVRVHFRLSAAQPHDHEGRAAMRAPLPAWVLRMQRRDAFRVRTPVARPVLCFVTAGGREVALPLDDIGAGGIGAFDDTNALEQSKGSVFKGCRLDLPEIGAVSIDLRLVQTREVDLPNGKKRHRLGFSYERQNGRALQLVQRYVSQLEREAIAHRRGLS